MNILAIDTTTKKASVAFKKGDTIYSKEIDNEITHSEKLLPLIDSILKDNNVTLNEIDLYAITLGPGSFTGVRIGIATIKAIAKVTGKKIFGTTSLELLALEGIKKYNSNSCNFVLSLMDARNGRVYYNLYEIVEGTLSPTDFAGNDYAQTVLENVKKYTEDNILITIDNNTICNIPDAVTVELDLRNIFDLDLTSNLNDYLSIDAMYYRKSEAERTKDGE